MLCKHYPVSATTTCDSTLTLAALLLLHLSFVTFLALLLGATLFTKEYIEVSKKAWVLIFYRTLGVEMVPLHRLKAREYDDRRMRVLYRITPRIGPRLL